MTHRDRNGDIKNRILRALSATSLERIRPHFEPVSLPLRKIILRPGEPVEHVYFVEDGFVSLVKSMADGRAVEVGGAGREGLAGISALYGILRCMFECVVRLPGSALRINSKMLLGEMARNAALRELLLRYGHAAMDEIAQTAACNRLHTLEQRCARWLLILYDAGESNTLPLTQEFLAVMLGVQRPRVSVVLNAMHQSGLIDATRGHITVTDRSGLERASCECYRTIRQEIDQIFMP